ncbi:MAG: hypothetical protein KGL39_44255 [Patescibacteria group bacterium]|nr:hypothetical protein [Patescibacteria group bacterium]
MAVTDFNLTAKLRQIKEQFNVSGAGSNPGVSLVLNDAAHAATATAAVSSPFLASAPAAAPSATASTYGTAEAVPLDSGFASLTELRSLKIVYGSVATETVTAKLTFSYSDGSTAVVVTDTTTANATHYGSPDPLIIAGVSGTVNLHTIVKSGVRITGITVAAESSISSSTATVTVTAFGVESQSPVGFLEVSVDEAVQKLPFYAV